MGYFTAGLESELIPLINFCATPMGYCKMGVARYCSEGELHYVVKFTYTLAYFAGPIPASSPKFE